MTLTLLSCGCEHSKDKFNSYKDPNSMIEISSYKISSYKLQISYTIDNVYNYDIWICDGINRDLRSEISLQKNTLFLRYFSSLPYDKNIFISAPPIAYYTKVLPNSSVNRRIEIDLPVSGLSSFFGSEIPLLKKNASCVELQVGYLTIEDVKKLGIWAKEESNSTILVQVIRDIQVHEKILNAEINGIKIPVRGK